MPNHIPTRFSEQQFARYAPALAEVIDSFPGVVFLDHYREQLGVASETFLARLRDAITAKKKYHWVHPLINDALFIRTCDEIVISQRTDGTIVAGPEDTVRKFRTEVPPVQKNTIEIVTNSPAALHAACTLVELNATKPTLSFLLPLSEAGALQLKAQHPNAEFIPHGKEHHIVI